MRIVEAKLLGKNSYREKAAYMFQKVMDLFYKQEYHLFLEHYPPKPDDKTVSYLWPFSSVFSAVNAITRIPEMGRQYEEAFVNVVTALEQYFDKTRNPHAYQAYPGKFGGDDRFYDDNAWLGIDFMEAYCRTEDKTYLRKAKVVFQFILSGWSDELGGGIYWCEQKRATKNTCSNGPTAILALELYKVTGDKTYLDWGQKVYDWTRKNLQSPNGVYWDSIDLKGNIDQTTYTYNTGTMIHSAVLLYQVTGNTDYLEQARKAAKSSLECFAPQRADGKRFFPNKDPWFTTILFRGYMTLFEVEKNPFYIDAVIQNIDYAWEYARDQYGLIERDWSGENKTEHKWLLDEACMIELYARAALLKE